MLSKKSVVNRAPKCHELSTAEHYQKLLHFARWMFQGTLIQEDFNRYAFVQEHYARVINDEICDFISLQNKRILDDFICRFAPLQDYI